MDSKVVSSAIKKYVHPFLKKHGFTDFASRSAWRFVSDRIEVINFQSFNSHKAEMLVTTTYSFGVNLGSYLWLRQVPAKRPTEGLIDVLKPEVLKPEASSYKLSVLTVRSYTCSRDMSVRFLPTATPN